MWAKEEILDEDHVYRQCYYNDITKEKGLRFPNEGHFKLKSDEDGLSVNWDKRISLPEIFILIGISQNVKGQFKDHRQFQVFKYKVRVLKSFQGIETIEHDPKYYGNPSPIGKPNNPAHTLVKYPDDEEIRINLSDYTRNHNQDTFCAFDVKSLNETIDKLRQRLPDVKYNRDWAD